MGRCGVQQVDEGHGGEDPAPAGRAGGDGDRIEVSDQSQEAGGLLAVEGNR
jgi:hypothetical protein